MANPGYVRSTDGSDADDGSTWALANATLTGAMTDAVAGDAIYVSDNHAESIGAAISLVVPGTIASPVKIVCANDAAEPPTAIATTGTVTTTGTFSISLSGPFYCQGLTFNCGTGSGGPILGMAQVTDDLQVFENCRFRIVSTGTAARIRMGGTTAGFKSHVLWKNCYARLANASQAIRVQGTRFDWEGGQWEAGGTSPTAMIESNSNQTCVINVSGLELISMGASTNLFAVVGGTLRAVIRECALNSSWSGQLVTGLTVGSRVEMYNCDSGATNYRLWIEDYFGSVKSETVVVRTGGASDGVTPLAWLMQSTANAEYPHQALASPEIVIWNDTVDTPVTVELEVLTDGVTLTDAECWLEVLHLYGTGSDRPWGNFESDAKASFLTTAAAQTSSSETWTTTGVSSPVKQKLSVTLTSKLKGFLVARVMLARASTSVYVDPKLAVT
jgi:hypothetical protein